jgi:hypothetical protein
VTQTALQRKLVRTASSFNSKARRLGLPGTVSAEDLARAWIEVDGRCAYCRVETAAIGATYDHAVPFDKGGENRPSNIRVSCVRCQRGKFTMSETQFLEYRELKVRCPCGIMFKPRAADYRRGFGRYHSRACAGRAGGEAVRT